MASTKVLGGALNASGDILLYLTQGAKRYLGRLSPNGAFDVVRTLPSAGLERFDHLEPDGLPSTIVLVHPFDALLYRYPLSGRGTKFKMAAGYGGDGAGMVNAIRTLGDRVWLLRSRGIIEVFDGEQINRIDEGIPRVEKSGADDWGADDIVKAWGGHPCVGMKHGIYRLDGTVWKRIAEGRLVRAAAFDLDRNELCVVGKSVAFIREDGSEDRFSEGFDDLWEATFHEGDLYAYSVRHGLLRVGRDGEVVTLGLCAPAPKNRSLISTTQGLVFLSREDGAHRLRARDGGWESIWNPGKQPLG